MQGSKILGLGIAAVASMTLISTASADYINTFDTSVAPLRYDFGGTNSPTVTFDGTKNLNGPAGSGSAKMTFSFAPNSGLAYTADVFGTPTDITNISFDLFVDPSSSSGAANHGAGYFQVATRLTDGYNFVDTGYAENLGNPSYDAVTHYGVWEHISIPLTAATGTGVRAITFQDYNNDNIPGQVIYYVDNLVLTTVPEPASLGLLAASAAGLLARRRRA